MANPWEVALAADDGDWSPSSRLKAFVKFRRTRTDQLLRRAELPPITIVEVAEDTNVRTDEEEAIASDELHISTNGRRVA